MNLNVLLVIFNTKLNASSSFQYFVNKKDVELIVIDNSTNQNILEENKIYSNDNFEYIQMGYNAGLSKAYNLAINKIELTDSNYVLISDQDTNYPQNYIDLVKLNISNNPDYDVYCPIIFDEIGIMSPSTIKGKKYIHSKNTDFDENIAKYSFINSGMVIKSSVFEKIKYDENLFLDFIDHDFCKQLIINNKKIFVIKNVEIFQNFSGASKNSFEQDLNRFKLFIKDGKNFYDKWLKKSFCKYSALITRTFKLTIIHRKIDFIKLLLKELKK